MQKTINTILKLYILAIIFLSFYSCKEGNTTAINNSNNFPVVPSGFSIINSPDYNKLTKEKSELGRHLFYEVQLSKNATLNCGKCHSQDFAFSSPEPVSLGMQHEPTVRNVLSLANVGYYSEYLWDGSGHDLEEMMYHDLTTFTIFNNDTNLIVSRLKAIPKYSKLFFDAYGTTEPKAYLIARALASFVRTIISGNSRYDKYQNGDKSALNDTEIKGMNLFFSDKTNCSKCHSGILFTDEKYHNTGTNTHYFDRGRFYVTGLNEDRGKFRTPSLRNVQLTAPYTHNGELYTLDEVIENYNHGGRLFINKSEILKPLNLSDEEKIQLKAFLITLTDTDLLNNTSLKKPK